MNKRARLLVLGFFTLCPLMVWAQNAIYQISKDKVEFHSVAPNELIYASSDKLIGAIDVRKNTFVFKINIVSFSGFNSPLQREHFNENYMESSFYPQAIYSGKIIEEVDISKDGEYIVRSKGKLSIHGIEQERIITAHIVTKKGKIHIKADFSVLLADHNIKIPRIVSDKLSPDIKVTVDCVFVSE